MKLQDFVSETLVQIVNGVKDAQQRTVESGAYINPVGLHGIISQLGGRRYDPSTACIAEEVQFDVAVTVDEGKETKGGIGIAIGTIGLGSQGKSESSSSSINRIAFRGNQ